MVQPQTFSKIFPKSDLFLSERESGGGRHGLKQAIFYHDLLHDWFPPGLLRSYLSGCHAVISRRTAAKETSFLLVHPFVYSAERYEFSIRFLHNTHIPF